MAAKGLGRVEVAGEFRLGQGGVHLAVADVMHQDGRAALATLELWHKVMQRLRRVRRDRAQAERADGRIGSIHAAQGWDGLRQRQGRA